MPWSLYENSWEMKRHCRAVCKEIHGSKLQICESRKQFLAFNWFKPMTTEPWSHVWEKKWICICTQHLQRVQKHIIYALLALALQYDGHHSSKFAALRPCKNRTKTKTNKQPTKKKPDNIFMFHIKSVFQSYGRALNNVNAVNVGVLNISFDHQNNWRNFAPHAPRIAKRLCWHLQLPLMTSKCVNRETIPWSPGH